MPLTDLPLQWYADSYVDYLQNEIKTLNQQGKTVETTKAFDRLLSFYEKIVQTESRYTNLDVVNIKKQYVQALYDAAEFYESISHETRELKTYQKLIEFDRTNTDPLLNAARLYEKTGLDWSALRAYENAILFGADSSDILLKIEELKSKLNT